MPARRKARKICTNNVTAGMNPPPGLADRVSGHSPVVLPRPIMALEFHENLYPRLSRFVTSDISSLHKPVANSSFGMHATVQFLAHHRSLLKITEVKDTGPHSIELDGLMIRLDDANLPLLHAHLPSQSATQKWRP